MKKLTAILLLFFILSSCKTVYTIGMTETEFKRHNGFAVITEATAGRTVYKNESYVDNQNHSHYQYFYFVDGKLVRINEREPDVVVEHSSN